MNYSKKADERRLFTVSFEDELIVTPPSAVPYWWTGPGWSELLTGTPTVVEVGTSDLTSAYVALNAVASRLAGQSVGANKAVQSTTAGGTARTAYTIRVTVSTDGSPVQTLSKDIRLLVN